METQSRPRPRNVAPQNTVSQVPKVRTVPDGTLQFSPDILKALDRVLGPR